MTVKTEAELNTDFADGFRTITAAQLRDFVDSRFAVGGILHGQDNIQGVTTGVTDFASYDASLDTKGVNENLVDGTYTIQTGADGSFSMAFVAVIEAAGAGAIEFGLHKNGVVLPFRCSLPILANTPTLFSVIGGTSVVATDVLGVKWQGSANASVTVHDTQFRVVRA